MINKYNVNLCLFRKYFFRINPSNIIPIIIIPNSNIMPIKTGSTIPSIKKEVLFKGL
jgi:hypothetical protein